MSETEAKPARTEGSEQEFLHDISTPLAVAYGSFKVLQGKYESDPAFNNPEISVKLIDKAVKNFERVNELLKRRRSFLRSSR